MDNGDEPNSPSDTTTNAPTTRDDVSNEDAITINTTTDDDDEDDDLVGDVTMSTDEEDTDGENGVQRIGMDSSSTEEEEEDGVDPQRRQKKRKMRALLANYEFAPRLPAGPSPVPKKPPTGGGRNGLTDWTLPETFVLLNAWGDRLLLKQGRKGLSSEQWKEVTEKVNEESRIVRTETQCKNRIDTLKKKYKKDKAMLADGGCNSSWVYFKKMDALLCAKEQRPAKESASRANVNPARADLGSPEGESEELLPPKRAKRTTTAAERKKPTSSYEMLADSINRFSKVYEKIETSSSRQLAELERIRVQFNLELEMEKREIVDKMKAEIEQIRRGLV